MMVWLLGTAWAVLSSIMWWMTRRQLIRSREIIHDLKTQVRRLGRQLGTDRFRKKVDEIVR